jgi:hypothetical protein
MAARPAPPPQRQTRPVLAAAALVLLTVAALLVAGAAGRSTGPRPVATGRLDVGSRAFSCTGGLPGTTAEAGSASSTGTVTVGGQPATGRSFAVRQVVPVVADRAAASSAYAVQQASGSRWLAALPCPEPRASWWFVGAGASDRHRSVLTVTNPRPGAAIFDVDVFAAGGHVDAPDLHGLTLGSGQSRTLDLARVAPASGEVAVRVRASRGLVTASAAESWSPSLLARSVRAWVAPQPAAARQQQLVGLPGGRATLLVANATGREAVLDVQVVGPRGTFTPTGLGSVTMPADSVRAVPLGGGSTASAAAIRLSANVPVAATVRSVQAGAEGYATAAPVLRGTSVAGVPPRVRARLVLAAATTATGQGRQPTTRADVRVLGRNGRTVLQRQVAVPAAGATTLTLPAGATAVTVTARGGDVTGSVLVSSASGRSAYALAPPASAQRSPGVLPAW